MIYEEDVLTDLDQLRSRYEVLRRLGRDGSSHVYAVRSRDSHRHYLVKVMEDSGEARTKPDALHLWQAHTVRALEHPKLMTLHAVHYLQGGAVALAMDRRRGRTLAELLDEVGPLSTRRVEHVLRDAAEALAYLHSRGVVHRGVRPASIFLDQDLGHARLAHFGVDRNETADELGNEVRALLRMFSYLAPEQIAGRNVVDGRRLGPRTDLYSLGLVGYAMLAGRDPWQGRTLEDLLEARRQNELTPIVELRPDVPVSLREAVEGCLATNPRRRWRSVAEFMAVLDPSGAVEVPEPVRPSAAEGILGEGIRIVSAGLSARPRTGAFARFGVTAVVAVAGVVTVSTVRGGGDPVAMKEERVAESAPAYEVPVPQPTTPAASTAEEPSAKASAPRRVRAPRPDWTDPYLEEIGQPEPRSARASAQEPSAAPVGQQFAASRSTAVLGMAVERRAVQLLGEPLAAVIGNRR